MSRALKVGSEVILYTMQKKKLPHFCSTAAAADMLSILMTKNMLSGRIIKRYISSPPFVTGAPARSRTFSFAAALQTANGRCRSCLTTFSKTIRIRISLYMISLHMREHIKFILKTERQSLRICLQRKGFHLRIRSSAQQFRTDLSAHWNTGIFNSTQAVPPAHLPIVKIWFCWILQSER